MTICKQVFSPLGAWSLALFLTLGCTAGTGRGEMDANSPTASVVPATQSRLELLPLDAEQHSYALTYTRCRDCVGPRVVEVSIEHPGLAFLSAETGVALNAAGKDLTVQAPSASRLRLVALSAQNVTEIESGVLATLHFALSNDSAPTLEIVADRPAFAPQAANDGLLIGDPLHL